MRPDAAPPKVRNPKDMTLTESVMESRNERPTILL
jgi:hypothetical protein